MTKPYDIMAKAKKIFHGGWDEMLIIVVSVVIVVGGGVLGIIY